MKNLLYYVGFRHLQSKPIRTILTTLGVALGIALYVAIAIINRSTLGYFRESVDAVAGKASLSVLAGEAGFPESRLSEVEKAWGVKAAVPMIVTQAYLAGTNESLAILGVDLLKEQSVRTYKTSNEQGIEDPLIFLNQPDSIILTHAFADRHHLKMDSPFDLATVRGKKRFVVRGLLSAEGPAKAYGGAIGIMDIDAAQLTFGKEKKFDRIDLVLNEGASVADVSSKLETQLGAGFQVQRPESQAESTERVVHSFQTMLTFFSTLALLVGLFLVSNSVSISVAERRREIGTLRALGANRRGILFLFLTDAAVIGLIGSTLGLLLGRGLASSMLNLVTSSMSAQFKMRIELQQLHLASGEIGRALCLGILASILAALWPAYKATQIQPLEALKRSNTTSETKAKWSNGMPILGALMLTYLVIASYLNLGSKFIALEYLNQICAIIGNALVGPPIVIGLVKLFRPLTGPIGGTITRLAEENLLRNPRRTGSNIMSLMVGLLLVILISTINMSFKHTVTDWFDKIRRGDLLVSSTGNTVTLDVQPLHEDLGFEIGKIPGVDSEPIGSAYAIRYISLDFQGDRIAIKAYDRPSARVGYSGFDVQDRPSSEAGPELYDSPTPVAMVSDSFVRHFKHSTGDTITLNSPSGPVPFKIIAKVVDFASPNGVVYMSRSTYKKYWKDPLVTFFGVKVLPGYDILKVRQDMDRKLARSRNLQITSNAEFKEQMASVIDQSFAYTRAIEAAALLVGLLGLLNTLLISVLERTRELGMLRAIGMSRQQLFRMILEEALIQGVFGSLAAVVLGTLVGYLWVTHSLATLLGWMVHFYFPWESAGILMLLGTGVALMAGIFPARRAANLQITNALEYE